MAYYATVKTSDGDIEHKEVTSDLIVQAFSEGKALVVCSGDLDGRTINYLDITGREPWDDRGKLFSDWEETWTVIPETIDECLQVAYDSGFFDCASTLPLDGDMDQLIRTKYDTYTVGES